MTTWLLKEEDLDCKVALFSMEKKPRFKKNIAKRVGRQRYMKMVHHNHKRQLENPCNSGKRHPVTYGGKALHNIANVLPAVMSTYLFKDISIADIRQALQTFTSSAKRGRLNFFQLNRCTFLIDFAHNTWFAVVVRFYQQLDYPQKIGVITGTGDRRDEDIKALGEIAAGYFDRYFTQRLKI